MDHPNSTATPTVSVVGHDGTELRINRSEFENPPEGVTYQEWGKPSAPAHAKSGKAATKKDGSKKEGATTDNTLTVISRDDRFFIADGDGNVIEDDDRYDHENGYATDAEAWTAAYADPNAQSGGLAKTPAR